MKKRKKIDEQAVIKARETALTHTRIDAGTLWTLCDNGLISAPAALYILSSLNCNLATGQGHRIEYETAALATRFSVRAIYKAVVQLEEVGLIQLRDRGGYVPILPRQGLTNQIVHAQQTEKRKRDFYKELRKRINEKALRPDNPLHYDPICKVYEALVTERKASKRYRPRARGTAHILPELNLYAPD